jgi:hypothetical protein
MDTLLTEITGISYFIRRKPLNSTQYVGGERNDAPKQFQYTIHCDSDDAERQQEQPDDWIEHQDYQRQRPAEKE